MLRSVGTVPPSLSALDWQITWLGPVRRAVWDQPNRTQNTFVAVTTRPSSVLGIVFASGIDFAQNILIFFAVIATLFALVELISVLIGVFMTRTITGAVHNLYEGTLRVAAGDFSSRIPVKGRDQLADLSWSFNKMTEQLENLVETNSPGNLAKGFTQSTPRQTTHVIRVSIAQSLSASFCSSGSRYGSAFS